MLDVYSIVGGMTDLGQRRAGDPTHQDEAGLLQMPDQPLSGNACHGVVSVVDAALAVVQQRMGKGPATSAASAERNGGTFIISTG